MKTSKQILTVLFSVLIFCNYSQTVEWAILHGYNSNDGGYITKSVVDASGNSYAIGGYVSSGGLVFGTTTLNTVGNYDIYITKTTASGTERWAKSVGGTNSEFVRSISIDGFSNIYVAGTFSTNAVLGTYTLTDLSQANFISKVDSAGNILWAYKYGAGANNFYIYNMHNDAAGNLYVAGSFISTAVLGSFTITSSAGSLDGFVMKIDNTGNVIWAKRMGGSFNDDATGVISDAAGNIYVTGGFNSSAGFGPYLLTSSGSADAFITKLTGSGSFLWAKKFGGTGADLGNVISSNTMNRICLGGEFTSPVMFDAFSLSAGRSFVCQLRSGRDSNPQHFCL